MLNKSLAIVLIAIAIALTFIIQMSSSKKEINSPQVVSKKDQRKPPQPDQPELVKLIKRDLRGENTVEVIKVKEFNVSCLKNSCAAYLRERPSKIVLATGKNQNEAYKKILKYVNQ